MGGQLGKYYKQSNQRNSWAASKELFCTEAQTIAKVFYPGLFSYLDKNSYAIPYEKKNHITCDNNIFSLK